MNFSWQSTRTRFTVLAWLANASCCVASIVTIAERMNQKHLTQLEASPVLSLILLMIIASVVLPATMPSYVPAIANFTHHWKRMEASVVGGK